MMMVVLCVAFGQTNNLQQIWTASQIISEFFYFSRCIFLSNFCENVFAVSMYAQIFRNAIFFYIWWNSLTIFGRCTYFSLKQLNNNFILHISKHGQRTLDNKFWAIWGTFGCNLSKNFSVYVIHHFALHTVKSRGVDCLN